MSPDQKRLRENERKRLWAAANRERSNAAKRRWEAANPGASLAAKRAWKANNPERVKADKARWAAANPDKIRAASERYQVEHPERCRENLRKSRALNPHMLRLSQAKRRAQKLGCTHRLTGSEWLQILELFDHRCAYCLLPAELLTQDHVIALSRGGEQTAENVVPACTSCNCRKSDRPVLVMVNQRRRGKDDTDAERQRPANDHAMVTGHQARVARLGS